ncbi:MAG: carboxypeptidase regulatory-like domain-containing protein [Acidobacteriota bacterium]
MHLATKTPSAVAFWRLIFTITVFCVSLAGQQMLSTLRGTVTDPSGSVVPGVEVSAEEVATNIKARVVSSDSQGNYEMPGLKQGVYKVTAKFGGFQSFVVEDIPLASNQIRRVDIQLQVGAVESQLTVSGRAAAIETEQGKISAEVTGERYKDIPVPGNRYSGTGPVLAIMPYVSTNMTFAGQLSAQRHMGMDGIKEEAVNSQTIIMEAQEEVRLITVNNSAEFSRVGFFDTVTKRGANRYHGELSYYQLNSALNAREYFAKSKPVDKYHQFIASVSGPVFKDKTFFYAVLYAERVPGKTFFSRTMPTEMMQKGDFSQLLKLSTPVAVKNPLTGQPFPGNVIPTSLLSSLSLKVQEKFVPIPNRGGPDSLVNNFEWVHPYPSDQFRTENPVIRVDHNLSMNNSLYGRVAAYWPRYVTPGDGAYPRLPAASQRQSFSWAFVDTHVFSPSLVNTFTFGGNRDGRDVSIPIADYRPPKGVDLVRELGLTGLTANLEALAGKGGGSPIMEVTGFGRIAVPHGGRSDVRSFTFADALTGSSPRHVLKMGGEVRTYRNFGGFAPEGTFGRFSFNGSLSGNAWADFLLGLPYSSERLDPLLDRVQGSKELGFFITDTFKISKRLNLDYGVRWDYFIPTTYKDGLQFNWDAATGNIVVPEAALKSVRPLYPSTIKVVTGEVVPRAEKTNFAPRLGFAYRLSDRTVVRGGYGIFNEFLGAYVYAQGGGPFQISETYFNAIQTGQALFRFPNPFPTAGATATIPSQSAGGYPRDIKNGYIHQFNLTVERQLHDVGVRMSYVGSRNVGMNYTLSLNKPQPSLIQFSASRRPYPQFVGASFAQTNGKSNYDSLTLEAKRRTGWVTFDAFWTWAHTMFNYLNLENPYNPNLWNRDDVTPRHRGVINTLWDLPFGRGKRYLSSLPPGVNHVLGGWKIVWLSHAQTGQFFSPSFSGRDPSNTNTSGGRADRICNGNLPPGQRKLERWFDTSCFAVPPAGRFGNSGVNVVEGPAFLTHNVSITKRFPLTERLHLDYMLTISNLFNHPNFTSPASNISVPAQAGVITSQQGRYGAARAGARFMDMRLRLEF